MINNSIKDNLLVNVLVSPITDFSGNNGKTEKETLLNRVEKLSESEQKMLSNELDKIINIKNQNEFFLENGVGFLLIDGMKKKSKQSHFSFFISSQSKSIIDKIEIARNLILSKKIIEKKGACLEQEFIIKCLENVNVNLSAKILGEKRLKIETSIKVSELSDFLKKIKNKEVNDTSKDFILSLTKVFKSDTTEQSKKMFSLLSAALVGDKSTISESIKNNVSPSDLLLCKKISSYNSKNLIESVIFQVSSKLILEKINDLQSKSLEINSNIDAIDMMLARAKEYTNMYVSNSKFENNSRIENDLNYVESIINSVGIMISSITDCKDYIEFKNEFNDAFEIIHSGLGQERATYLFMFNGYSFSLFDVISFLFAFIRADGKSLSVKAVSDFLNYINKDMKTEKLIHFYNQLTKLKEQMQPKEGTSSQKMLADLHFAASSLKDPLVNIDANEIDDLKMKFCKTFFCYLNELFLVINQELIQSLNLKKNAPNEEEKVLFNSPVQKNALLNKKKNEFKNLSPNVKKNFFNFSSSNNIKDVNNSNQKITEFKNNNNIKEVEKPVIPSKRPIIEKGACEKVDGIDVLIEGQNGTSFEDRKTLAHTLFSTQQVNIVNRESSIDGELRDLKNHPLITTIYQNFYFIMKGNKSIAKDDFNWGGLVFMKQGNWQDLVYKFNNSADWNEPSNWQALNNWRREALKLTIKGITLDS